MNYNTVYIGMDVHKESFTLCSMTIEDEKASHYQKTEADYKKVLKYLEFLRTIYGGIYMRLWGWLPRFYALSSDDFTACGVYNTCFNYYAGT